MKKTIIISVFVAIIFFSLGYVIGGTNITSISSAGKLAIGANTYQAGYEAAKKRLTDSDFFPPIGNFEIKNVSGQVAAIKGNIITLKIKPLEPLADPSLDERIVKMDANTKIYALEQKDQALYQKEMEEFSKKMQEQANNMPKPGQTPTAPTNPIMPPEFFIKKEVKISDIKVEDNINIIAVDKDIKNAKEFTAAEIRIISLPVATPPLTTTTTTSPVAE